MQEIRSIIKVSDLLTYYKAQLAHELKPSRFLCISVAAMMRDAVAQHPKYESFIAETHTAFPPPIRIRVYDFVTSPVIGLNQYVSLTRQVMKYINEWAEFSGDDVLFDHDSVDDLADEKGLDYSEIRVELMKRAISKNPDTTMEIVLAG